MMPPWFPPARFAESAWQDLHAFSGHLVQPDDVRPGDVRPGTVRQEDVRPGDVRRRPGNVLPEDVRPGDVLAVGRRGAGGRGVRG